MLNSKYLVPRYLFIIFLALAFMPTSRYAFAQDITTGLVGHWKFDEISGTTAPDSSGNNNTGTLTNGPTWTTGKINSALSFDGTDDYVNIGNMNVSGSGITIAAWVKADSFSSAIDTRFISKANSTDAQDHYWMLGQTNNGGDKLRFRLKAGGSTQTLIASSGNLPTGTWFHAIATYDGATMRLYKDGIEVGSVAKSGTIDIDATVPANIGRNPDGSNHTDGTMDDIRIYNRALTSADIQALYAYTGGPPDIQAPTTPTSLSATAVSSSQINLSWSASTDNVGVTGYRVYRGGIQIASPSTTSYSDTGLSPSTTYSYTIAAVDGAGNISSQSTNAQATTQAPPPPDTQAPSTPTNLSASAVSSSQINLSWTASTDNIGVIGYRVERCQGSGCTAFSQIATPIGTTYNDTGLSANTTYRYQVRAADAAGNLSGYSSIASATTQTSGGGGIPSALGWYPIPNTKLRSVCAAENGFPDVWGVEGCGAITAIWNSGAFDTARNRLLIWGGGHNGYYGNELYAMDLDDLTMQRLTDPGLPTAPFSPCVEAIVNGTQPNSRHTYDGIEYLGTTDRFFAFGGSLACGAGYFSGGTWTFSFSNNQWQYITPAVNPVAEAGVVTAYDSNSGKLFLHDRRGLYSYDGLTNSYTLLSGGNTDNNARNYHSTGVIDTKRKKFVIFGENESWIIDINTGSSYALQSFTTSGGSAIVNSFYPGLAYDPVSDRIVAWIGGDTVYSLNLDTNTWTPTTYSGGPTAMANGTYGRWNYSPSLNVFVTCNSVDINCYTLRLTTGSTLPPPDTQAPTMPTGLSASAVSSSQINLSWTASTDNVGVAGYRVERCQGSTCTNFVQIATPTGTSYSDTGLTANTTYRYQVRAADAANNLSNYSSIASAATQAGGGTSADADFQARCNAAGVVKCWSFDNTTTEIVQGINLFPDGGGVYRGGLDTSIKASGAGSLRFTVPPPPHAGANIAGKWEPYLLAGATPAYNGIKFGPGDTFYTQIRMRLSPDMLTNTWDSYWKFYEMIYNQSTCGTLGIVYINQYMRGIPTGYTDCGGRHTTTLLDGQSWTDTPPLLLQQGDYNCQYGFLNPTNCFYFSSNRWMTFYFKVRIGAWGQANSSIEAWVMSEGDTVWKKWQNITNYDFYVDTNAWGFNNAFLGPYMTALSSTSGKPGVTSYMWYDEFIISTQPIAAPGATPPTTLVGDLNQDRTVNSLDWTIMANVWFTADATADINKDGIVNSIDFSLMNANWGRTN